MKRCPHCDLELEHVDSDPEVGIVGHWFCAHCELTFDDDDEDYEP